MPVGRVGPFTPTGEVEQFGKVASDLVKLTGRRRTAARLLVFAFVVFPIAFFVVAATLAAG